MPCAWGERERAAPNRKPPQIGTLALEGWRKLVDVAGDPRAAAPKTGQENR
jgi:hypothetical protein